jgi:phage terminase large subunit GpA-like protein
VKRRKDTPATREVWSGSFPIIDHREIYDWAAENLDLPAIYSRPGPFCVHSSRYLIEPLKSLRDDTTRRVTVMKAIGSGGTLIADVAVPWFILYRPGPILWTFATDDQASEHATSRMIPLIRSCAALRPLLPHDPRLIGRGGIQFAHAPLWVGGSAKSQLQSKQVLLAICDECWLWESGRLEWAEGRTTAFRRVGLSKFLVISQPGVVGDDLDQHWKRGTCEEWQVACPLCNALFVPTWSARREDDTEWGIRWDTNEVTRPAGVWNVQELLKTVRFECPHCRGELRDGVALKSGWNTSGRWVVTNSSAEPGHRSFRWSALIIDSWENLVQQFVSAKDATRDGVYFPMRTFVQQRLSRPWDTETAPIEGTLAVGAYDAQAAWPSAVARFLTVDVQEVGYWAEIREWAADGASRQLFFGRLGTETEVSEKAKGFAVRANCVFLDCGFDTRRVYEILLRNQWTGLKGEGGRDFFRLKIKGASVNRLYSDRLLGDPGMGTPAQGRRYAKFFLFAADSAKGVLVKLRDGKGPGFQSLPNPDYQQHIFAEQRRKVTDKKTGKERWGWVQVRRENHGFDCSCMQVVAALMHPKIRLAESGFPAAEEP